MLVISSNAEKIQMMTTTQVTTVPPAGAALLGREAAPAPEIILDKILVMLLSGWLFRVGQMQPYGEPINAPSELRREQKRPLRRRGVCVFARNCSHNKKAGALSLIKEGS